MENIFDANIVCLFDVLEAFAPLLIDAVSDSSSILTIDNAASVIVRILFPFSSAYNAIKGAVSAYLNTLRLELSLLGIRVIIIFIGKVLTRLRLADGINFGLESLYVNVDFEVKERNLRFMEVFIGPVDFAEQFVHEFWISTIRTYLERDGHLGA